MELKSSNGMEITLDLLGYQFPKLLGEPYDSNWLRVQVRAVHPRGAWTSVDPTLLTYEVAALADWLELAAAGGPTSLPRLTFTEPNLQFEATATPEGIQVVRVMFELESRPPWSPAFAGLWRARFARASAHRGRPVGWGSETAAAVS